MNTVFLTKLIKAKKLEYDAIKEILPRKVRNKVDLIEKEIINLAKDIAIEMIKDNTVVEKKTVKKVGVNFK